MNLKNVKLAALLVAVIAVAASMSPGVASASTRGEQAKSICNHGKPSGYNRVVFDNKSRSKYGRMIVVGKGVKGNDYYGAKGYCAITFRSGKYYGDPGYTSVKAYEPKAPKYTQIVTDSDSRSSYTQYAGPVYAAGGLVIFKGRAGAGSSKARSHDVGWWASAE